MGTGKNSNFAFFFWKKKKKKKALAIPLQLLNKRNSKALNIHLWSYSIIFQLLANLVLRAWWIWLFFTGWWWGPKIAYRYQCEGENVRSFQDLHLLGFDRKLALVYWTFSRQSLERNVASISEKLFLSDQQHRFEVFCCKGIRISFVFSSNLVDFHTKVSPLSLHFCFSGSRQGFLYSTRSLQNII